MQFVFISVYSGKFGLVRETYVSPECWFIINTCFVYSNSGVWNLTQLIVTEFIYIYLFNTYNLQTTYLISNHLKAFINDEISYSNLSEDKYI